ncbi:MAG: hypothetical protein C4519_03420 [Desulfobacteraceae bacterium]|nr:MAG: hypothetical protein C4519_03420 [Desulfobacteraceae bacterium]
MSEHEKYEELAAGYVLGALDEHDRHRFEFHLAGGCEQCETSLREARQVTDGLGFALKPMAPRKEVRAKLFDRIRLDDQAAEVTEPSEPSRRGLWAPLALAASLLLVVGLSYQVYSLYQNIETERMSRREAEKKVAQLQESFNALVAPQTRTITLAGQGQASGAQAKAFIDPAQRRIFLYVYNLPPTPPGKTYQLWLIVEGTPVSAGIFEVNPDGSARFDAQRLQPFEGPITVAVTVEPAGGVPQPTGPMVLSGT